MHSYIYSEVTQIKFLDFCNQNGLKFGPAIELQFLYHHKCTHQSFSTTGQHHAGQGDADREFTRVDSAQRDAYRKACDAIVSLSRWAPLFTLFKEQCEIMC